jgi:hypothetical protein
VKSKLPYYNDSETPHYWVIPKFDFDKNKKKNHWVESQTN